MAVLPEPELTTPKLMFGVVEKRSRPWKSRRLGGSSIGKECERALWYQFRWASTADELPRSGRSLRLRESGNEQEPLLAELLREGGIELYTVQPGQEDNPRQPQIEYTALGGHFVVYLDGIGRGFPEAPTKWHVVSFKLGMAKYWKEIVAKGLQAANAAYAAQAQIEMHLSGVDRTIVIVRNRDTEDLHAERVRYSVSEADRLLAKAQRIIATDRPPARLNDDPEWYACKLCDHQATCHGNALPAPSCRTCIHATPRMDGNARWTCAADAADIDTKRQLAGCERHVYLPDLLASWAVVDDASETGVIYINHLSGHRFEQGPAGWTSADLRKLGRNLELIGSPDLQGIRDQLGAEIVSVTEAA